MLGFTSIRQLCTTTSLSVAMFVFPGCDTLDSAEANPLNENLDVLIPTNIWINAANEKIQQSSHVFGYNIFAQLETIAKDMKLYFDDSKSIYQADLKDLDDSEHSLYFEENRIVFSKHIDKESNQWIIAYALNKPYAAAQYDGMNWLAIDPKTIPLNKDLIVHSYKLALDYGALEKKEISSQRILSESAIVQGSLEENGSYIYTINAIEGDILNIRLENPLTNTFFTLSSDPASRMEHKAWAGKVKNTGDITIRVFSSNKEESQQFMLNIVKSSPENLADVRSREEA